MSIIWLIKMYISQKLTYEQVRKKFNGYVDELVKLLKENMEH